MSYIKNILRTINDKREHEFERENRGVYERVLRQEMEGEIV